MTTAVADLPSLPASTAGGISAWIALLERRLSRESLTPAETAFAEAGMEAARVVGAPLLKADSRDDLNERIDRAMLAPEFAPFAERAHSFVVVAESARLPQSSWEPSSRLVRILGAGSAKIFEEGVRLMAAMLSVVCRPSANDRAPASSAGLGLVDIVTRAMQAEMHSTLSSALFEGMRSAPASLGVMHALREGRPLAPWLALALAETVRNGVYAQLRVLASLPFNVPESMVPLADRYDVAALQRAYNARIAEIDALPPDHENCEVP